MSKSSQQDLGQLSYPDHLYMFTVCVFFFLQLTMVPKCLPSLGPLPSTVNGPVWMIVQQRSKPGFYSCLVWAVHKAKWGSLSSWLQEGKALTGPVLDFKAGSVLWPSWDKWSCFSKWLRQTFVNSFHVSALRELELWSSVEETRWLQRQLADFLHIPLYHLLGDWRGNKISSSRLRWTEPPPAWVSSVLAVGPQEVSVILRTPFASW